MLLVQGRPAGKSLVFAPGAYYFGRGAECHVRPNSDWVSRQHCLLRVTPEAVFLRDLGSRNGTLVNGALLECERQLRPGDQVQVGPLVFEVRFETAPPASPAPPATTRSDADTLPEQEPEALGQTRPLDPELVSGTPPPVLPTEPPG